MQVYLLKKYFTQAKVITINMGDIWSFPNSKNNLML